MKPRNTLFLAVPLLLASISAAQSAPGRVDPALPAALGISEEQILDLCSYSQDVLSTGKQSYWSTYCEPAPKQKELVDAQRFFKSDFDSHVFSAPNRKAQVQELANVFTEGELAGVKDDSNREKSQQVYLCMVKADCLSGKAPDQLADIEPPVNSKTFPAWLPAAEANKMLPFLLIYENEKLRQAKFKELNVPVNDGEREKFCKNAGNKDSCARFEANQRQIETNKAALDGIKGISDPAVLSRYMENAVQRTGDVGLRDNGVLGQWRTSTDDPSMPLKPQQKLNLREAPAPAAAPQKSGGSSISIGGLSIDTGTLKKAAGGAAAGATAMLAWRSGRKKGERDASEEDKRAEAGGEYTGPKTADQASSAVVDGKIVREKLSAPEQAVYDRAHALWKADGLGDGFEDFESWFTNPGSGQRAMGQNSTTSTDAAYKSLLNKINSINGRANR